MGDKFQSILQTVKEKAPGRNRQEGDKVYVKKPLTKKQRKKRVILASAGVIILVGAGVGVFVFTRGPQGMMAMAQNLDITAEARSAQAENGSIETTVVGSGNIQSADAQPVKVLAGIKVSEVLVESGDQVAEGDTLAVLDMNSINSNIASVQSDINTIDEKLDELSDDDNDTIEAYVSGRVKKIYAGADGDVVSAVLENGALMLLSVDGKMAVDIETSELAIGDAVTVTLSDGTEKSGTVSDVSGSTATVTVTDNGPDYGEQVTVADSEGTTVGEGSLYIHQQVSITGSGGTISSVDVSLNDAVEAGDTLFTLSESVSSTEYQEYMIQREELVEKLQTLLALSKDNTIKALYSGTIASVNLSEGEETGTSTGSSGSDGSGLYGSAGSTTGSLSAVTAAAGQNMVEVVLVANETVLKMAAADTPETEEEEQTVVDTTISEITGLQLETPAAGKAPQSEVKETNQFTGTITWKSSPSVFDYETAYTAKVVLTAKEGYCFSGTIDDYGFHKDIWAAVERIDKITVDESGKKITFEITFKMTGSEVKQSESGPEGNNQNVQENTGQENQEDGQENNQVGGQENNQQENQNGTDTTQNGTGTVQNGTGNLASGTTGTGNTSIGTMASGSSTASAASGTSGASASSAAAASDSSGTVTASSVSETTAFTITPDDSMQISITIDELDILSIEKGQEVALTLDALDGSFTGEVSEIADTATASGGVVSYAATVILPKEEGMKAGMSASATIIIEKSEDIVTIPVNALQEMGNRVFVYTALDEETGMPANEAEVETGLSDGDNVEIISGLSAGDTVYYTIISSGSDSDEESLMDMGGFGNMGGGMVDFSGEMPSGDFSGERPSGGPSEGGMGGGMPGGQ